jgi:hypothetical protein
MVTTKIKMDTLIGGTEDFAKRFVTLTNAVVTEPDGSSLFK